MNTKKLLITFIVTGLFAASAAVVSAQGGWIKLGQKDVDHSIDHDTVVAHKGDHIKEIHLSVTKAPVKFRKVIIHYADGVNQEVEFLEDVALGHESRAINIEGDGHVIKTIDFWYETDSLGGKKAKVTVYGRA